MELLSWFALFSVLFSSLAAPLEFRVSSNKDDFPGRRQGGGTHWVVPAPTYNV